MNIAILLKETIAPPPVVLASVLSSTLMLAAPVLAALENETRAPRVSVLASSSVSNAATRHRVTIVPPSARRIVPTELRLNTALPDCRAAERIAALVASRGYASAAVEVAFSPDRPNVRGSAIMHPPSEGSNTGQLFVFLGQRAPSAAKVAELREQAAGRFAPKVADRAVPLDRFGLPTTCDTYTFTVQRDAPSEAGAPAQALDRLRVQGLNAFPMALQVVANEDQSPSTKPLSTLWMRGQLVTLPPGSTEYVALATHCSTAEVTPDP